MYILTRSLCRILPYFTAVYSRKYGSRYVKSTLLILFNFFYNSATWCRVQTSKNPPNHVSDKCLHVLRISASIIVCLAFTTLHHALYTTYSIATPHICQSPCSTTLKAPHKWLHPWHYWRFLHLLSFLHWSAWCQAHCRIMQWPNGLMEGYGKFISRGLLVVHGIITNFCIRFYFLCQSAWCQAHYWITWW